MPLTPKNRKEQWLEGLVQHETTLTPKNRPEAWIKEIIDASGGGGGGTGGGVLIVNDVSGTLDKTWKEIYDATTGGKLCFIATHNAVFDLLGLITTIATDHDTQYGVAADNQEYATSTEDGYPVHM